LVTADGILASAPATGGGATGPIKPSALAWLVDAQARSAPLQAWATFWAASLAARAVQHPDSWSGIWSTASSYAGSDTAADLDSSGQFARALLPAMSSQIHAATLRAIVALAGLEGGADYLRIAPRFPSDTFSLKMPRFELAATPVEVSGSITASATGPISLEVELPTPLLTGELSVVADDKSIAFSRQGDFVIFDISLKRDAPVAWAIRK